MDCRDPEALRAVLRDLADDVGRRLREAGKFAGVGRLKLRWADFQTLTRQRTFPAPVCDDFTLRRLALEHEQLSLFDDPADRRDRDEKLCHTVDRLREKLGRDQLVRADRVGRRKET